MRARAFAEGWRNAGDDRAQRKDCRCDKRQAFQLNAMRHNVELTGRGNNHVARPVVDEKPAYSSSGSTICYPPPEWVAPTIQRPQSARPGKHFTTIDVSRRARGDDRDEKQLLFAFASCQKAAVDNG